MRRHRYVDVGVADVTDGSGGEGASRYIDIAEYDDGGEYKDKAKPAYGAARGGTPFKAVGGNSCVSSGCILFSLLFLVLGYMSHAFVGPSGSGDGRRGADSLANAIPLDMAAVESPSLSLQVTQLQRRENELISQVEQLTAERNELARRESDALKRAEECTAVTTLPAVPKLADGTDIRNHTALLHDIREWAFKQNVLLFGRERLRVRMVTSEGDIELLMAPWEDVPYATHYWLSMAMMGYWDGCHFVRNAGHVIQANCNYRKPPHRERPSLIFQDYSPKFTHRKFTMGIAGRPGGPDFYLGIVSNVANHGPGGQDAEADPCIADIVSGEDVAMRIHQTRPDGWLRPEKFAEIERVELILPREALAPRRSFGSEALGDAASETGADRIASAEVAESHDVDANDDHDAGAAPPQNDDVEVGAAERTVEHAEDREPRAVDANENEVVQESIPPKDL